MRLHIPDLLQREGKDGEERRGTAIRSKEEGKER